jgi:putative transcriptional regulator
MTQNHEPLSPLAQSILRGLEDVAAYARGDHSRVRITRVPPPVDIKAIRQRTGQNQKTFAETYHINTETLRSWEQGKRTPPDYAVAYLKLIEKNPNTIRDMLTSNV